jgi:hypothetical protein
MTFLADTIWFVLCLNFLALILAVDAFVVSAGVKIVRAWLKGEFETKAAKKDTLPNGFIPENS